MSGPGPRATLPPAAARRVETGRMVLSAAQPAERQEIVALLGNPLVGRWLGGTLDPDAAAQALERWSVHWAEHWGQGLRPSSAPLHRRWPTGRSPCATSSRSRCTTTPARGA